MSQGELPLELASEVFSIKESVTTFVLWLLFLFPPEYLGSPLCCTSGFHIGHGPYDFGLLVLEIFGAATNVGLP